jgi:hypothetical protein
MIDRGKSRRASPNARSESDRPGEKALSHAGQMEMTCSLYLVPHEARLIS